MRRTFFCLLSSILMYCLYVYTLPPDMPAEPAASAAAETRITAQIELPSVRLYAVTLGTFDTEYEAHIAAAVYARRGTAGCTVETENGWTILGTGYASDAEASSVCTQLRKNEGMDAGVMLFSADTVHLSMTAAASQTDAVSAALALLSEIPDELMAFSAQLDSGSADGAAIRALISLRSSQADQLLADLTQKLGTSADIFCRLVETSLSGLCDSLACMCVSDGPAGLALSSALKQCALETVMGTISMMHTLG